MPIDTHNNTVKIVRFAHWDAPTAARPLPNSLAVKKMSTVPTFTWSDSWLLHSIAVASGVEDGATLANIVGCGDAINHAIFTAAELRRGFGKLTAAGYLVETDGRFRLAGEAVAAWERVNKFRSMDRQRKELDAFLIAEPYPAWEPGAEDPAWPYPLTNNRIAAAQVEYRRRMSKAVRKAERE